MNKLIYSVAVFGLLIFAANLPAQRQVTQPNPDFTRGDQLPPTTDHDWNLGPTGARGWIYSNKLETTQARQILITKVASRSPADGILKQGDVILGIDSERFSSDPRVAFGKAIGEAEGSNGKLKLIRWRNKDTETVSIKLAKLGKYSDTAPFDCRKSQKIFQQGCQVIAQRMANNPRRGDKIVRSLNALALLSSGRREYLPLIREQAQWASKYSDTQSRELCSWYYGPINLLLAEYTLATGDRSYLPNMKRICLEIAEGQSDVGSWGHRFARPDGRLNGYGMMNAPGVPLTASLALAKKAGVKDAKVDEALEKSLKLLRFYAGKGSLPYGDHEPWIKTHDDNGKNGIAALMFNMVGEKERCEFFSHMSLAAHSGERELGHTGNFFNLLWAMPGVALSGPEATGQWMKEYGWYFDLARKWDGSFEHQGPAQTKKDKYSGWDSTGSYMLAYGQALRNIHLTGAQPILKPLSKSEAASIVADGRGFSNRNKNSTYAELSLQELYKKLENWSPVVRQRAAEALKFRKVDYNATIARKLRSKDSNAQLGGCQAVTVMGRNASKAVPDLRRLLKSKDLWVRINAANALGAIGNNAKPAIPQLLAMVTLVDLENDPRGMEQRYLSLALFDPRSGLLRQSLNGVDRKAVYEAVRSSLQNQDGRARGAVSSLFTKLSLEELKPILPAIHDAVKNPAPSGIMFADKIRLNGLELLAKHKIEEGMQLCVDLIEPDRWGLGKRIPQCLKSLESYGSAAKGMRRQLEEIKKKFYPSTKRLSSGAQQQLRLINQTLKKIDGNSPPPKLQTLKSLTTI